MRIAEAMQFWSDQGYKVTPLERMLNERNAPENWEQLLRGFNASVEKLHALEQQAIQVDAGLAGNDIFLAQAACASDPNPAQCFAQGATQLITDIATNTGTILGRIRRAGYTGPITVMNLYSTDYTSQSTLQVPRLRLGCCGS